LGEAVAGREITTSSSAAREDPPSIARLIRIRINQTRFLFDCWIEEGVGL